MNSRLIPPFAALAMVLAWLAPISSFGQVAEHERRIDELTEEIQERLLALEINRNDVAALTQQDKELRDANLSNAAVRRKLDIALADLKEGKKKIKVLLHALEDEYDESIRQRRENLRRAKALLKEFRKKLEISLALGDAQQSAEYAARVARYNNKIKKDTHSLRNAESHRDASLQSFHRRLQQESLKPVQALSENAANGIKNINFNRMSK
jgi:septal ring factor EnvC (AmiA/AmiB activator)